ncbi:MAG: M23 family metallopeptidase [Pseudomonadota bacterium]
MRTRLGISIDRFIERYLPERRVFLKSDGDTRFIRLRPMTQLIALSAGALLIAWSIVVTAVILMDSIGAGNFREQAKRDQQTYLARLNDLSAQRDLRAVEALAAQERFSAALRKISAMQSELLAAETRIRELETGLDVIQGTLRDTMRARQAAQQQLAAIQTTPPGATARVTATAPQVPTGFLADTLARTAKERDQVIADAQDALDRAAELEHEIAFMHEQNDVIFRQLEAAMTVSVAPLDQMFRDAGLSPDRILESVRRGYAGQGGPMTPISFSTRGAEPTPDSLRANRLLNQMDRLNIYRIAAEKAPFDTPVKSAFRFTSQFGFRRDPKTGGRRMHAGVDFAARTGTPIYATADGVITHAGWQSGYGRMVKIQHEFGIETRYAHLSRTRVKVGQRVSRGQRIGDMGATGRVTGVHLHYEVRVGGKAVDPMTFIKAGRNVF